MLSKISYRLLAILALLVVYGVYVFTTTSTDIFWSGFLAMVLFYFIIFYIGAKAQQKEKLSSPEEVLLAGRSLPIGIAILTMSATWLGGGFINGPAEAVATSGLVWAQAPWGYALSLIIGGLFFARVMRRNEYKTMLDPLEHRFGKKMAAVLFLPALSGEIFWSSAILLALGTTFGTILGLETQAAIILSAIVLLLETFLFKNKAAIIGT